VVLKDHWKRAVEVLSDLVSNMDLKEPHFLLEKAVVLQELSSSFENHEDHIYDEFLERAYRHHPLGKPILGNEECLTALTRKDVTAYYRSHYVGRQILVSCAGNVDHGDLVHEIERHLKKLPAGLERPRRKKPKFTSFFQGMEKNTDQVHMLMGLPTGAYRGPWRFEAFIVNALLGGGMTSKLFQSVRERRGLTYSIYSSLNTFTDAGLLMVYASMEEDKIKEVAKTILNSMVEIRNKGVSANHLKLFKTQVIGSILLGSEDVENRMTSLAINEMVLGRYKPVHEVIDEIQSVSQTSLHSFIEEYFHLDHLGGLLLGPNLKKHASWWADFLPSK
jgi:predicted Zn-dependent peptidase